VTGLDRHGADVETPLLCVQAKLGRCMPAYLNDWLSGIRGTARQKDKIGIVVWRPKGKRDDDAVVLIALKDFEDLHGELKDESSETNMV